MIGGPSNKQNEYLAILSSLTHLVRDKELRSQLIQAKSAKEVFELIQDAEGL
jgi:mannitol/fructose-specific phosphotransferase system IIA component (Ntr-type)